MTDNTQPEALRALAESVAWTGRWYDAGCNTVHCTYDKEDSIEHDEIAHPVPLGVSGYIAAAHPQAVIALLDRIAELEAQLEAVGAGGVSGPMMGQPQAMPDLSVLTERGAKAWAGVDVQGLREEALRLAESLERRTTSWTEKSFAAVELRRLHAENERLAALVDAQQPAPSAAAAPVAVKAMGYGGSTGINDYLMSDGTVQAMRPSEVKWAPQPSPTPQADSQPAPFEVADAMADSQYLAGVSAGWNAANADDPNAALQKLHESRAGYLKPLRAARAPADSVTAPAAGAVAGPVDDLAELALLNRLIELGSRAACAHATSNSDDGHKGTAAYVEWQELRAEMGELIRTAYAAAPTPPAQAADSVLEDAARRDALEEAAQLVEKATYRKRWVKAAINGQANNVPPCELAAAIRKLKEDTQ